MIDMACGGGEARFSEDHTTANAFGRTAMSRRNIIAGLIVMVPIPTLGKAPYAKDSSMRSIGIISAVQ
jgi:hypothetical protein